MEFQEKLVFAKENPVYDAIPLIIIDKMGKKYPKGLYVLLQYSIKFYFFFVKIIQIFNF